MNAEEAREVLRIGLHGAAKQDIDDARAELMALHLAPLPFERTRRRVHEYVLEHKWLSSLEELLDAAGVPAAARPDLARAIHEGGELWPSLRSMSGWEYVGPTEPLPEGVALYCRQAGAAPPAGGRAAALPAQPARNEPATPEGAVIDRSTALREINASLARRTSAALRRAYEEREHPPTLPGRDTWPPALVAAVESAEAAEERTRLAERRCLAQERAYRELCADLEQRIRDGAPDADACRPVAVELLERLLADPGHGLAGVVDVLRDAVVPGAKVEEISALRGDRPDPFDDAPGPIEGLRVVLRRSEMRRAMTNTEVSR